MSSQFSIDIKAHGFDEAARAFQERAERARAMAPEVSRAIHAKLLDSMRQQFATGGRHGGHPWTGYGGEPRYARYKRALTGDATVLRWRSSNERLYPSLTQPGHAEHVFRATGREITFGSRVPHLRTLERGGTGPFGERYPPRRVVVLSKKTRAYLARLIAHQVNTGKVAVD